jgi:hemoglobin
MMADLDSRTQVHDLVLDFYRKVTFDELLGPVFGEVAEVDWAVHIPILIDYWCRVLLGQPGYEGHLLDAHQHLHELEPLAPELFDRWYSLFVLAIDGRWQGPMAAKAKAHAAQIAGVLAHRVAGIEWIVPDTMADR